MKDAMPAGPDYPAGPSELVTTYLIARGHYDQAKAELEVAQAALIKEMEADQRKTYKWNDHGLVRAVTYVIRRTTEVDEQGLRKALTAKVFDKYTTRKLDRKAMEAAMDAGEIDPVTVSRFVSIKPSRPFLEYREKEDPQ